MEVLSGVDISLETRSRTIEFHRRVLDTIRQKDEDRAFKLMQNHIADVQKRLKKQWSNRTRKRRANPSRARRKNNS
jgi:DNA-binding GntR family transcriptional regulator